MINNSEKPTPEPEWARPAWISKVFGVPRTTIYLWIKDDLIVSASFRKKGQSHGQRFVLVQSVRDLINSRIVSGNPRNSDSTKEPKI